MEAIFFALVTHVGWATSDIFGAIAARRIGGYATTFWSFLVRIPLLALYLPFDRANLAALTIHNFLISVGLALVLLIGTVCFFEAFRGGNSSLVGTIGSAFVVPTVLLSVLVFGERLDLFQSLAAALIVMGLVVTTLNWRDARAQLDRATVLALMAMVFWGVYFAFIRIPVEEIGWFLPAYIGFLCAPAVLIPMRLRKMPLLSPFNRTTLPVFVAFFCLGTMASFAYNLGISSGHTAIVAPIAGSYPILFVFLSRLIFKEPLLPRQAWGIALSLLGILALALLA